MQIQIDGEFQSLIPSLSAEEKTQLEVNLVSEGCRDALVVWNGILIDGHNRYEICTRLGIEYRVVEKSFASREEASDWIDANQLGRRNLRPEQMSLLRGRRYNRTKKTHGGQRESSPQNDDLKTAERLAQQHGVSKATIERDGKFAEAVEALGLESDITTGAIEVPKQSIVEAAKPLIEAKKENRVPSQDEIAKARAHVANNSGNNEWYTPSEFIESARTVLGTIDCDPASSKIANKIVKASTYFTKDDDGLKKRWFGNVWMNPPYAQPLMSQFAEAVTDKYSSGEFTSAIVLVNNATETAWFQKMLTKASAVCFVKSRIKFIDVDGKPSGAPLQGQAILYFGKHVIDFSDEFQKHGKVLFNE